VTTETIDRLRAALMETALSMDAPRLAVAMASSSFTAQSIAHAAAADARVLVPGLTEEQAMAIIAIGMTAGALSCARVQHHDEMRREGERVLEAIRVE
jgi:hypothetical protein